MKRREEGAIARWIAYHLPERICYWVLIRLAIKYMRINEIVPEVGFTEVLSRIGRPREEWA